MRASTLASLGAVVALAGAGCSGGRPATPSPSPTATAAAATPSRLLTPETCNADGVRSRVQEMLAGRIYETHYLTINGALTLSVWLVDPQIDQAAPAGPSAGSSQALETGLTLSYQIVDQIPCVAQVFENVNPMIVDTQYASWYYDIIPARAFLGLQAPTTADLVESVARSGAGPAPGRFALPRVAASAPSGSCTWPQARSALTAHLGPEGDNTAAYIIIGGGIVAGTRWDDSASDVAVQVQIEAHQDSDTDDGVLMARLDVLAQDLACVHPTVEQLELFVVNDAGRLVVYARVPGNLIGPGLGPLPPGMVLLCHFPAADQP